MFTSVVNIVIVSHLSYRDVARLQRVCRDFYWAFGDPYLWKQLFRRDFPELTLLRTDEDYKTIYRQHRVAYHYPEAYMLARRGFPETLMALAILDDDIEIFSANFAVDSDTLIMALNHDARRAAEHLVLVAGVDVAPAVMHLTKTFEHTKLAFLQQLLIKKFYQVVQCGNALYHYAFRL